MAARNITLAFGELVSLSLKKESAKVSATEVKNLCVGQPDKPGHDPSPRKAPYVCTHCGPIVDNEALVKGVQQPDGTYAIVSQDDVAEAKAEYAKDYKQRINLVAHPAGEFLAATAPGDSVSYLYPSSDAMAGQYATIAAFIEAHPELVFVGLHTPVSATNLFQVTARDGVLVMEQRTRSQSLKKPQQVDGEPMVKLLAFLDMTLEDSLVEYDPEAYEDSYANAVATLAATSTQVVTLDETPVSTPVAKGSSDADLLAKLAALSETKPAPKKRAAKKPTKKEVAA